jgi:hypothetical protein
MCWRFRLVVRGLGVLMVKGRWIDVLSRILEKRGKEGEEGKKLILTREIYHMGQAERHTPPHQGERRTKKKRIMTA